MKREGEERHNRSFEADVNYLLTEAPRPHHLWLVPAAGGKARRLTSGEWSVLGLGGGPSWSPDGNSIAFKHREHPGMRYMLDAGVRIVDVASGSIRELNVRSLEPRVAGVKFSPDGTAIAYSAARDGDFRFVSEIFVAPVAGGIGRSLTDFNAAIAALELGKVEPLRWRGADNFEMDGVLTFPPGYQAGRTAAT